MLVTNTRSNGFIAQVPVVKQIISAKFFCCPRCRHGDFFCFKLKILHLASALTYFAKMSFIQ
jgi:hypothetical protein